MLSANVEEKIKGGLPSFGEVMNGLKKEWNKITEKKKDTLNDKEIIYVDYNVMSESISFMVRDIEYIIAKRFNRVEHEVDYMMTKIKDLELLNVIFYVDTNGFGLVIKDILEAKGCEVKEIDINIIK